MRLFLGLELPAEIRDILAREQLFLPLARPVAAEQMHLTLAFMGELAPPTVEAVDEELHRIRQQPFSLMLEGFGLFGRKSPRVIWAGVAPSAALEALQARVTNAARRAGCTIPRGRFVPHVTIGRFADPPLAVAMRIERAVAAQAGFRAGPWQVDDMVLWQSRLHPAGARHLELARYPLEDDPR